MDLSTTYLGLKLPNPFVVGAGPLADELDQARALEDAGASMIILRSLFEEEITGEQMDAFFNVESYSESFAEAGSFIPEPELALGPDEYLEHLRKVKQAVRIPVMASLNGVTRGGWIAFAKMLEQAGADGIELHIYHAASDITRSGADVEREAVDIVREVKRSVRVPIAIKLSPFYTSFTHFAKQLDDAGADGLVVFTRFHHVDLDVEDLNVVRKMPLSDSSELSLRIRGAATLSGRVKASIGITGGVHTALDVVKATMAGAHVTQLVSVLLRHGSGHLRMLQQDLEVWLHEHEWPSLTEMRGNMGLNRVPNPQEFERVNFRMALR